MKKRKKYDIGRHPSVFGRTRRPVAHPNRPERILEIVQHRDVRMIPPDREQSRVSAAAAVFTVPPEREKGELPLAVGLLVIVQNISETPPVAVAREQRPENVRRFALAGAERTKRRVVGLLFVKGPDLKRGG